MEAGSARQPQTEDEWRRYYELRWRILRAPWQQARGSERDEHDNTAIHRMVCDDENRVVAVGRLHFLDTRTAQIRYMAVAECCRRRGFGRLILQSLETAAQCAGCTEICLHAREASVPFYRKAGYHLIDKSHVLFDEIQHFAMQKHLSTQIMH